MSEMILFFKDELKPFPLYILIRKDSCVLI